MKFLKYFLDVIFQGIVIGVVLALVIAWLSQNGYLNLGG